MISNERPSPFHRQPYRKPYQQAYQDQYQPYGYQQPRPQVQEDSIKTIDFAVERKTFRLALKENPRGRFLRITESNGTKFNSVMVPASGLIEFQRMVNEIVAAGDIPSHDQIPPPQPLEESVPPQAHIEVSVAPEPEPVPLREARTKTAKASTKPKAVRKKAAKEA